MLRYSLMKAWVRLPLYVGQSSQTLSSYHGNKHSIKPLQTRKNANAGKSNRRDFLELDGSFEENYKRLEEIEEMAEEMTGITPRPELKADPTIHRSLAAQERRVKYAMVQREHFRPEPERNLLTWDAKAQMRFLHAQDPEVWSPEQLAQSFPISAEGAKKVVNNRWEPRCLQDIIKHDQRVHKNWEQLKVCGGDSRTDTGGPLFSRYERMVSAGKLHLLGHAAGISALPRPEQKLLPIAGSVVEPVKGRFSDIVKGYYEKKQLTALCKKSDLVEQQNTNQKLIEGVINSSLVGDDTDKKANEAKLTATYAKLKPRYKMLSAEIESALGSEVELTTPPNDSHATALTDEDDVPRQQRSSLRLRRRTRESGMPQETDDTIPQSRMLTTNNFEGERRANGLRRSLKETQGKDFDHNVSETELDLPKMRQRRPKLNRRMQLHEFLGTPSDNISATSKLQPKVVRDEKEGENMSQLSDKKDPGFEGTGKVEEKPQSSSRKYPMEYSNPFMAREGKFREQGNDNEFFETQYDRKGDETESYMYEEGKGYRYPFGRSSNVPKDFESVGEVGPNVKVYRENNTVYDEDGEI